MTKKFDKRGLALIILIFSFIGLACIVHFKSELMFDTGVYGFLSSHNSDIMTTFEKAITNFGGARILCLITIAMLIILKNKIIGLCIGANLLLAANLNFWVKFIFKRERPNILRLIEEKGYSFPSGHAMTSAAFYGFLIYLIGRYVKNRKVKVILIAVLTILIILIGLSRVYLGVHYASDLIGGYLLATIYLIIFISFLNKNKILK